MLLWIVHCKAVRRRGKAITTYTLTAKTGFNVQIMTTGARLIAMNVPVDGTMRNVLLGYEQEDDWAHDPYYMGVIAGRYANRINKGRFVLDRETFQLTVNDGDHHLHGGAQYFGVREWQVDAVGDDHLTLSLFSADGEEGYPGNLHVTLHYAVTADNELSIHFQAETDKPCPVSLTSHPYFNLSGSDNFHDHTLHIEAEYFTETDADTIPTGRMLPVSYLPSFKDLDHNMVVSAPSVAAACAKVYCPPAGLGLAVFTNYPGLQVYGGMHLAAPFKRHAGFCLEPQFFPDSPNQPTFPNSILRPGEKFDKTIRYRLFYLPESAQAES